MQQNALPIMDDFPHQCNDGTYSYVCRDNGGEPSNNNKGIGEGQPTPDESYRPSVNAQFKSIFDVSKLTENQKLGLFIGATIVVLYLIK